MSAQVTITISRDDAELLQNILLLARHAEVFLRDPHGGNEGQKRLSRLATRLENAEQMTKENSVIDDLERQFKHD